MGSASSVVSGRAELDGAGSEDDEDDEDDEDALGVGDEPAGEADGVEAADGDVGPTRVLVSSSGAGLLSASVPMAKPTARQRSML